MGQEQYLANDEQDEKGDKRYQLGDIRSFLFLWRYSRLLLWRYAFAFSLILGSTLVAIIGAHYLGLLVGEGIFKQDYGLAKKLGLVIIGLELFSYLLQWGGRRWLALLAGQTLLKIRQAMFHHFGQLPMSYFDRNPQGRIITRLTHDVESLESFFTSGMGLFFNAIIGAIVAGSAMVMTSFHLGFKMILAMFLAVLFLYFTKGMVRTSNRNVSLYSGKMNAKLSEFISGLPVIRSLGLEHWSIAQFDAISDQHLNAILRSNVFYAWSRPLASFLCSFPLLSLIWWGGNDVLAQTMSVALFVTFVRYFDHFYGPIMFLARELHTIQEAFTSAERVGSFLLAPNENEVLGPDGHWPRTREEKNIEGKIEFKDVWLSYNQQLALFNDESNEDHWALRQLSFTVKPGEKIGLVGRTGCGKTSTVSLLPRLYKHQRGEIKIDGHNIEDYQRSFLRRQIGLVSQDVFIFKGSLKENLTLGCTIPTEQLQSAIEETGLRVIMEKNHYTLETQLLEGGSNLSQGEKQLISLTRVLLQSPAILVLDEATSNVDPYHEDLIHRAVFKLMKNRTCLLIAHRLQTLAHVDRIFVFQQGQLVEEGSAEMLIKHNGVYAQLHHWAQEHNGQFEEGPRQ